jgi:hypothetical protein
MRDITQFPIGARLYDIKWDQKECERLGEAVSFVGVTHGVCDHSRRTIWLNPKVHKSIPAALETLLHELLHVCEPFVGKEIKHPAIDAFALNLYGILEKSGIVDPDQLTIAGWTNEMLAAQVE